MNSSIIGETRGLCNEQFIYLFYFYQIGLEEFSLTQSIINMPVLLSMPLRHWSYFFNVSPFEVIIFIFWVFARLKV
jgi:hypothetical protein